MSVAEEITLGEIARRLDFIVTQLAQLVTRSEHEAHLLLRDQRIGALVEDVAELKARLTESERQRGQVRLALATSVVAPLIVAVLLAILAGATLN